MKDAEKPHYHGHRQRLRKRFLRDMGASMEDYEILELLLTQALPRGDVKPLAKNLLAAFGSYANVISADREALTRVPGIKDAALVALKLAQASAQRLLRHEALDQPVLSSWHQLLDYCHATMAREKVEQARLLFLDAQNQLITDEVQQTGTINHTAIYPREVVKRALELSASALIMVHNHPSGNPAPSDADKRMTQAVRDAGAALNIILHDHLIIGRDRHFSFRAEGLL
ncbi:RadC family protein [Aestuariispira insulae]|uniref:DNA repair protein RadC n=1 Tax=Aestuariispira insulae TaxID=1461337 RepID=A0A3D9HR87_9PROT|nr:DNA repair protein RadC [Aestuariispira insulae]RED51990.1 DNA repair protein RadC [Aestuariispira insulae]